MKSLLALVSAHKLSHAVVMTIAWLSSCGAGSDRGPDPRVVAAVSNSVPLLQQSARTWFDERSCGSCHHLGLGMMTTALSRERGFRIDEPMFIEQLAHAQRSMSAGREEILQGDAGINAQIGQSYKLFALAAGNAGADSGTDVRARYLMEKQAGDGRWRSESHRPPHEDSEVTATAIASRAIQLYTPRGAEPVVAKRVELARAWLESATPRDTEDRVMQLFGLAWTRGSGANIAAAREALLAEQRPDGGWAQIATRESDAYATGQTLVALNQAAGLAVTDAAYRRGVEYLLKTQHADGSWLVETRRKTEGLEHFETGFPHGEHQFIAYAGSCWATMALLLTVRPGPSPVLVSTSFVGRNPHEKPIDDGLTPLMDAVLHGGIEDVRASLANGGDVNAASRRGMTALMCAAGDAAKARLLLEKGAHVDARTDFGFTAAILAAGVHGGTEALTLLVENGADVNARAKDGTTALMRAALAGDHEAIELLFMRGVNVDLADEEGDTALHRAVYQGDVATLGLLLAFGADPEGRRKEGEPTLLHPAAIDGFPAVVEALLEGGARIDARDELGRTALMWAAIVDWGDDRTVRTLLARGADASLRDAEGRTALELALEHKNRLAAEALRETVRESR